jgi:membrane-associated phospholipid phosphatase
MTAPDRLRRFVRHSRGVQTTPLVPVALRRPALIVGVAGWLVVVLFGVLFANDRKADWFDRVVAHGLHEHVAPKNSVAAYVLLSPSTPALIYLVIVAVLVFALLRRRWELAGLAVLAPGLCVLVTEVVFKPLVDRQHGGYLSYPSGHTVSSVSAFAVAVLTVTAGWSTRRRLLAWVVWLLVVLCLTAGLVAMDYHYPTDTIGGFCLALGIILPGAVLVDVLSSRRAGRRTPTPERATPERTPKTVEQATTTADPATAPPDVTPREGTSSGSRRSASPR